jgi:hypothetical protein
MIGLAAAACSGGAGVTAGVTPPGGSQDADNYPTFRR